jgi:signal transduction histidine kinase
MKLHWSPQSTAVLLRFRNLLALLALIGSALGILIEGWISDEQVLGWVGQRVQQQFNRLAIDLEEQLVLASDSLSQAPAQAILLDYSREGELRTWNTNRYLPDSARVRQLMASPEFELLTDRGRAYYVIKAPSDSSYRLGLLPLYESYPLRNELLVPTVFLGTFNSWPAVAEAAVEFSFTRSSSLPGIQFHDLNGRPLGKLITYDAMPFRQHVRRNLLVVLVVGLGLGGWWLYGWLGRWPRWRPLIGLGVLVGFRLLLLAASLPQAWAHTDLFSARLLAVNALAPSLGDLTLNVVLTALVVAWVFGRMPLGRLLRLLGKLGPPAVWLLWAVVAALVLVQYLFFLQVVEWTGSSTKIYTEFNDLSRIDGYALLLAFNWGLLLWGQFVLSFACLRVAAKLHRVKELPLYHAGLAAGLVFLILQASIGPEWYAAMLLGALYALAQLMIGLATRLRLQFSFAQVVVLAGVFSMLTNHAVVRSNERAMPQLMTRLIQKYRQDRDIVQEYSLERTIEDIRRDSSLWCRDSLYELPKRVTDEVLASLLTRHLQPVLRGYDVVLAAFNPQGLRLDNQYDVVPLRPDSSLLEPTLAQGFMRMATPDRRHRYVYIAKVDLATRQGQPFTVQIELYPKVQGGDRLYPRLLSEAASGGSLPTDFQLAIYTDRQLVSRIDRQWSAEAARGIPMVLPEVKTSRLYRRTDTHHELIEQLDSQRAFLVRAERRSLTQNLTSLSILFYFYIFIYLLYRLPQTASRWTNRSDIAWYHRLDYRMQAILLSLALVPILLVWLLTSNFFRQYFHQSTRLDLVAKLQQVAQELQRPLERSASSSDLVLNELLRRSSRLMGCDINLYDARGRLLHSTIPRMYHTLLTSTQIDPRALGFYLRGWRGEHVQTETIGRLHFLSGYLPVLDPANTQLRALVNIPLVAQQDLLSYQIERFFSYLINVYVLLFLVVVVVGVLITRTLTRPLELLRAKLAQTSYGQAQEPIDWTSRDEIGALIASYNQMLGKLVESEKRVAQNEREVAWREMARQIAHEIKNPLTPMKLSIQHLSRILDRVENGEHRQAVQRLSATLLSQIDSLTAIASTFSQFATMPAENRTAVPLGAIVQDIFHLYAEADEAELSIELPETELYVMGDKNQLLRVLVNLVKNALQAMEKRGRIHLSLYRNGDWAICKVADNGKGIPIEIQDKVFQPNFSTQTSGMGLGLAITRRIIEGMNGRIRFESYVGQGTTFFLEFPIHNPEHG